MAVTYHQSENAELYHQNASFVFSPQYTAPVLGMLDPQPGDRVLDIGCGTGELSFEIAKIVCQPHPVTGRRGFVLGIDLSQDMVEKASSTWRKSGLKATEIYFEVVDAYKLERYLEMRGMLGTFDRVFSNAALHWMSEHPDLVMRNAHAALRPEGVLALEMGGYMNMIGVRMALHRAVRKRGVDPVEVDPWYFPSPEAYANVITSASAVAPFQVDVAELVPRITLLPETGLQGWVETFGGAFMNALHNDRDRDAAMREILASCRTDMFDPVTKRWSCMYVRLRVRATKGSPVLAAQQHHQHQQQRHHSSSATPPTRPGTVAPPQAPPAPTGMPATGAGSALPPPQPPPQSQHHHPHHHHHARRSPKYTRRTTPAAGSSAYLDEDMTTRSESEGQVG